MNIQLLGTGSAEGWPGLFCSCDVCRRSREVGGKNLRTRTSALLDGVVKIDFPPDTLQHSHLLGLDMTKVEFLVFTHAHDDHLAAPELQYLSWMFVPEELIRPLTILGSRTVLEKIRLTDGLDEKNFDLRCLTAWHESRHGDWSVTPIVPHHDPKQVCFNLLITRNSRTLLYATDTGMYDEPTWRFLEGVKIDGLIVECGNGPRDDHYDGHLSIRDVIQLRERLVDTGSLREGAPVVTTHMSHMGGLMHEELEELFAPHSIQVGYDGMEFSI